MFAPFKKALPVIEKIEKAGFEAYFVGGSVRDYILKKAIEDVDIATSALPAEIQEIFPKTVDVGIEHGTVLVLHNGESYEVTTFRSEGEYEDFRRPKEVTFVPSIYEDLKRRDFTMNALAMAKDGTIIDPFNGVSDIAERIIRTVGKAEERFQEDALRMMRAVRFVSQLSFQLDKKTALAIKKHHDLLEHIAVERKLAEFQKLLSGMNRKEAIYMLVTLQIHQYLPGLENKEEELNRLAEISRIPMLDSLDLWVILALSCEEEKIDSFMRAWKLSNNNRKKIRSFYHALEFRKKSDWTKWQLYQAGLDVCIHAEKIYQALNNKIDSSEIDRIQKIYEELPLKSRSELAVTGNDLMDWANRKSGPWIKDCLNEVEQAVVEGKLKNKKETIKNWLNSWNK